jgi:AmmeMemoRadiSam system protein B
MVRLPAVAGQFYSASVDALRADIQRFMGEPDPGPAVAAIAPHAGLVYSGYVAGAVYGRLVPPPTVILIGPNHTGLGPPISVYPEGTWVVPGGEMVIDSVLTNELLTSFPSAQSDAAAHTFEHCLEMQLPFLLHGYDFGAARFQGKNCVPKILAIVLGTTDLELCRAFGGALARLIADGAVAPDSRPLLIASTDMNHYESDDITRKKDALAIDAIERLDPDHLHAAAHAHGISMCGLGPTIAVLAAARQLRATRASLIRYATSGEVSGEHERVVGYAGFLIG